MIKVVFFDIDGVILNTTELLYQAFEHTLKAHKLPEKTREEISKEIGKFITVIYQNLAPGSDPNMLIKTHNEFQIKNPNLASLYEDTLETLDTLKKNGVKIAALSNRMTTGDSLKATGLKKYFDFILTGDKVTNPKPHPEFVLRALDHFKIKPSEALMVGDSPPDILCGRNAGVKTIGVTFGFHGQRIRKSNPDYVVEKLSNILPIVLKG